MWYCCVDVVTRGHSRIRGRDLARACRRGRGDRGSRGGRGGRGSRDTGRGGRGSKGTGRGGRGAGRGRVRGRGGAAGSRGDGLTDRQRKVLVEGMEKAGEPVYQLSIYGCYSWAY